MLLLYYILNVGMVGGRLSWTPWPWHSWRPNWEQTQALRQVEASLVTGDWFAKVIYSSSGEDWIKAPGRTEDIRTASSGPQDGIFLLCILLWADWDRETEWFNKKEAWIQKGIPYFLLVRKLVRNIPASYIIFCQLLIVLPLHLFPVPCLHVLSSLKMNFHIGSLAIKGVFEALSISSLVHSFVVAGAGWF